jgi:Ran GTPase-activating protein (RanGAP) involved in mRNA processing and transport
MAASLLLPLLRGLARNWTIQRLDLIYLDLSQVANRGHDIFSIITPFLQNQCLRCINIVLCKLPQNVSSLSFALSKCNQLEKIELLQHNHGDHSNSVAGRITRASFINSLRSQQNLLELTLYGQIEGNGYVELAALLNHSASKVTSLRLNSIPSDESFTILSDSLAKSKAIKKFEFDSDRLDNITATGWRAFSAILSDKTCALETLSLECTKMDDESATFLGDSLAANTTVKYLSLQGSRFTPAGWDGFARCLRSPHSALEELDISTCNCSANEDESDEEDGSDENDTPLDDYGAIAIAESLAMNSSLKKLNLSWNWITPEGWIEFFDVLLHSECSLEELDLSHNDIDDEGVDALVDLLASMRNFHTLSLHHNSFSMTGLRALTCLLHPSYNVKNIILGRTEDFFSQSERDRFNDEIAIEFADVLANNTS